jgi:hypothetical protein
MSSRNKLVHLPIVDTRAQAKYKDHMPIIRIDSCPQMLDCGENCIKRTSLANQSINLSFKKFYSACPN